MKIIAQTVTCVLRVVLFIIDKMTKIINYDKCIECMCCHELYTMPLN